METKEDDSLSDISSHREELVKGCWCCRKDKFKIINNFYCYIPDCTYYIGGIESPEYIKISTENRMLRIAANISKLQTDPLFMRIKDIPESKRSYSGLFILSYIANLYRTEMIDVSSKTLKAFKQLFENFNFKVSRSKFLELCRSLKNNKQEI